MPLDAPNFRMDGRVALLTGSGRGIGLAIARALASAGCAVAFQDVELEVAQAEADRVNREGGRAIALGGDITDPTLPARLVAETAERLGGLHVLVNNAAIQSTRYWLEAKPEQMERELRADVVVPIVLCRHAVPLLRRHRQGRILHIGSIQGMLGNPKMMAYAAAKNALEAVTKAMARDLAADAITVNLLCPGYFDTWRNRFDFKSDEDKHRKGRAHVPLGWVGQPEDIAGISLAICSDAGRYVTGQVIYVDGGLSVKAP
jgi:NAD(P)-dependent dehydrogenase (short-subunit alcohol dehydrogenase family)